MNTNSKVLINQLMAIINQEKTKKRPQALVRFVHLLILSAKSVSLTLAVGGASAWRKRLVVAKAFRRWQTVDCQICENDMRWLETVRSLVARCPCESIPRRFFATLWRPPKPSGTIEHDSALVSQPIFFEVGICLVGERMTNCMFFKER